MKVGIILVGLWLLSFTVVQAQNDEVVVIQIEDRYDDKLILEFTHDMWIDAPQGVKQRNISLGFNVHFYSDYTFGRESNFSFAWGLGVGTDNVHSNAMLFQRELPDGSLTEQELVPFPANYEYRKNKLVTSFIELPLEFRFIAKGRYAFRMAAGVRLGYLITDHQKIIDTDGKRKYYDFNDLTKWRYGLSARIGVGKIQVMGFYSLVPLIEGQDHTIPFSVGLALIPFR